MNLITKIFYILCIFWCFAAQAQPYPFNLISPSDGGDGFAIQYRLEYMWQLANGAKKYKIQVHYYSANPDWGSGWVYQIENILPSGGTTEKYAVKVSDPSLNNYTQYKWRVVAYDIDNETIVSTKDFAFTTIIGPPTLSSPANGATGLNRASVTLQWNSLGATSYRYRITTLSNDYRHAHFRETPYKTVTFKGLAPGIKYYWSVQALKNTTLSNWSGEFNFTTAVYSGPYDSNLAVTYAKEYTDPTATFPGRAYNPVYYSYSGEYTVPWEGGCSWYASDSQATFCRGDCTNFISQCLKAGGLNIPSNMNQTSPQIRSNNRGTIYSVFDLHNWLKTVYNKDRPRSYDTCKDGSLTTKFPLQPGDIIQLGKVFITSPQVNDPYTHSVIVTKVTEPTGLSGIFVTSHSFDKEDVPLSAY